tara:strand:+ start:147 stop:365 length:219 start_codon:yes stop_codon:yes gene_type:complete
MTDFFSDPNYFKNEKKILEKRIIQYKEKELIKSDIEFKILQNDIMFSKLFSIIEKQQLEIERLRGLIEGVDV